MADDGLAVVVIGRVVRQQETVDRLRGVLFLGEAAEDEVLFRELMVEAHVELVAAGGGVEVVDVVGVRDSVRVALVRVRVEGENGARDGADAGRRDGVAGEGLVGERVADGDGFAGEIAGLHGRGGDGVLNRRLAGEAEAFEGEEEEGAVLAVVELRQDDGAAEGEAEDVRDLRRQGSLAEGPGVEGFVLVVPEGRAVEVVGAAFRDGGDVAGLAEFGVVADTLDADFGDGFDAGEQVPLRRVAGGGRDGDAVDGGFALRGQAALDGVAAAVVGLDAGQGGDEGVGARRNAADVAG